jgi:hypothetical protein
LDNGNSTTGNTVIPNLKSISDNKMIYLIPPNNCDDSVIIDFVCICISPPLDNSSRSSNSIKNEVGGIRLLDNQLELMMTPTNYIDETANILSNFEQNVFF